jgi:DNA polymerase-3 subunit delta'
MIEQPVLHPKTAEQVKAFVASPAHAVLLVGPSGGGKTYLAQIIASQVLGISLPKLAEHPYYSFVEGSGTSIGIEAVRNLQKFLQLKTLGNERTIRRAIIVEHAHLLTIEAQNAFLKLLEEPPADTLMVLTADNQRALLPTILSRVQAIAVHTPSEEAVKEFFKSQGTATELSQAFFLSGGLPGLMGALLNKDDTHPLAGGVASAKAILGQKTFERLAMVEGLSKQKEQAGHVLEALAHIAQTGIDGATAKGDHAKLKQWHHILKVTHEAQEALRINANTKLTLTNLMLHL